MPDPILVNDALPRHRIFAAYSREQLREMVLKHPDLAVKFTPNPVKEPSQWMGFIPPLMNSGPRGWELNKSLIRTNLVTVCRAAIEREHGTGIADDWYRNIQTDNWSQI